MIREASHAGSWYSADSAQLSKQLAQWISETSPKPARFGIGPHAGYRFCGPVLANVYANLAAYSDEVCRIDRLVLMGPSHFKYFRGIRTTKFKTFDTPLGKVPVDTTILPNIEALDSRTDVKEHSWEMHMPFVARYLPSASVVPLLFGDGSAKLKSSRKSLAEAQSSVSNVANILDNELEANVASLMQDAHTAFVVSSDFCHWGQAFDFTPFAEYSPNIDAKIKELDLAGCKVLETGSADKWLDYISKTGNTVCGANPIAWILALSALTNTPLRFELLRYDKSSSVQKQSDLSVSYAALSA